MTMSPVVLCLALLQPTVGSVCVAPLSRGDDRGPGDPAFQCDSRNFSFRIDDRPVQAWSRTKAVTVSGLDVTAKHTIRTYCGGKPHQTFSFRFADYKSAQLCFFLNDLYLTPQLWERAPWCKCAVSPQKKLNKQPEGTQLR